MDFRSTINHYCGYQERCHQEVRNKLYDLGCRKTEVEEIISELIEKDKLNEERFAKAIVRGKFRLLHWGRNKIIQQLKQHKISAYCIKIALKEIDEGEYQNTLNKLAQKKLSELRSVKNIFTKKTKTQNYLLQKGFEANLIYTAINKIINSDGKQS